MTPLYVTFYHEQGNTQMRQCCTLMLESLRALYGEAMRVCVLTDVPEQFSVPCEKVSVDLSLALVRERLRCYRGFLATHAAEPVIFLDPDILVMHHPQAFVTLGEEADVALTFRPQVEYPLLMGAVLAWSGRPCVLAFFDYLLQICDTLPANEPRYTGDQFALWQWSVGCHFIPGVFSHRGVRVALVKAADLHYWPKRTSQWNGAFVPYPFTHFKGNRKLYMRDYWHAWQRRVA